MKFLFPPQSVQFKDFITAHERIRQFIPASPLTPSFALSEISGRRIFLKWDNKLPTGSFKERGVINFLAGLSDKQKEKGVCAASAGNHALALSHYAARNKVHCHLVMPLNAPLIKVQSSEKNGAVVTQHGDTFAQAYEEALRICRREKLTFVSPFDDIKIIAGQGSCAIEILDQLEHFDSVIVPVGGGGLIAGIASVIKERKPDVFILGVQSEWALQQSKNPASAQTLIKPATIADGIAVKQIGEIPSSIIAKKVDAMISVSEAEIAHSIVEFLEKEKTVIEGAAAAAICALRKDALPSHCHSTVVIVSGSNIDMNVLSRLLERDMGERGRLLKICISVPDRPGSLHITTGIIAKEGANVLQVLHDRSFSKEPGNVEITLLLEVRNSDHKMKLLMELKRLGLEAREIV